MNSLSRYYLPATEWTDGNLCLSGDEAHHCVRVLRGKVGDKIEIFDGEGRSAVGEIVSASKSEVSVQVLNESQQQDSECLLELCQAIPKGSNMEWIVQKSVELGVRTIQPLITENTVARAEQMDKKVQKWQRVVLEACKQCGQNYLPMVLPTLTFAQWMQSRKPSELEVVAALDPRSEPIKQKLSTLDKAATSTRIIVGPEGDLSETEYDQLAQAGMQFVSIGEIVLKVETATLYCISVLKYELGS